VDGQDPIAEQALGALAGGIVALGLGGGPDALVAGQVVSAAATGVSRSLRERLNRLFEEREAFVFDRAAQLAGISPEIVLQRLSETPVRQELLLGTLRAAQRATALEQLVLLAKSLAAGSTAADAAASTETAFVRAIADCDTAHIQVLGLFGRTSNELGIGNGQPAFDTPATVINTSQLGIARPDLEPVLDHVLATLLRHGLLVARPAGGGAILQAPVPSAARDKIIQNWQLTDFGELFQERVKAVGYLVGPATPATRSEDR
jgi:hypothetical protein